jgi:hypothetical protein
MTRDQQHALLVPDVDGEGHIHRGEDDCVVQGNQEK